MIATLEAPLDDGTADRACPTGCYPTAQLNWQTQQASNDVTQVRWQLLERRYFGFTFAKWKEVESIVNGLAHNLQKTKTC